MIKFFKAFIQKIRLWLYGSKVANTLEVKESSPWDTLHNYIVNYDGKIRPKMRGKLWNDGEDTDLVYEMIIPFNDYDISIGKKEIDYMIKGCYKNQDITKYLPKDIDFYYKLMRLKLAKAETLAKMEQSKQEEHSHIQTLFGGLK